MDEIAVIAQDYLDRHEPRALLLIEDQISLAVGRNQWGEVLKWHRVRHRLQRLQMKHRLAARDGAHRAGDHALPIPESLETGNLSAARPQQA